MRTAAVKLAFVASAFAAPAMAAAKDCSPAGKNRTELQALKTEKWVIVDDSARNRFAIELTQCLGNPDPALRDDIATEALQHYLRERLLTDATMVKLADILQAQLVAKDKEGFRRPFAALALSEVARADRIKAYLTPEQRATMLNTATNYMRSIADYRSFDPKTGYRHGVAHASDLMMQLALNPALGKTEIIAIRDAVGSQIAPKGQYYITGEAERLARPILYISQRKLLTEAEWTAWFAAISGPGSLGTWDNWFRTHQGLARRHNLTAFLSAIYLNADISGSANFAPLLPAATTAIKMLP